MSQAEIMFTEKAFEAIIIEEMAKGVKDKESLIAFMNTPEFEARVKECTQFFISKFV